MIPDIFKNARWIGSCFQGKPDDSVSAPYFRREVYVEEEPAKAVLYICGLGYFKATINGGQVSDEVLSQPFTKYDSTLLYSEFDITCRIEKGSNALGVALGNGWYNCFTEDVWNSRQATWRSLPKLIATIHFQYENGRSEYIYSDKLWKCSDGPIVFNGIRNGEHYDARLEKKGWDSPGYDDGGWRPAKITRSPGGILKPFNAQPIRITRRFKPKRNWPASENSYVFDMGVNMAGFCNITFNGRKGTEIIVKYSERLAEDGVNINQKTISGFVRSGEFQTDKYTKGTDKSETWHPDFVYHGFRFVEITGNEGIPEVEVMMLNTDFGQRGWFECSDEILNSLYRASNQATVSNFHGIPTDDPHREKNAWTGDVCLSAEQMLLNFDTAPILRKWLGDIRDSQKPDGSIPCVVPSTGWGYNWGNGPDWSSALILIPWYIYLYTGNSEVIEENYDSIKSHFTFMESMTEDGIVNYGIGDWCPPFEGRALSINMSSFKCPVGVTDTAYYYNAAVILGKMAGILNNKKDGENFERKASLIREDFRRHFFDSKDKTVLGDCQTSYACMLYQELAENDEANEILTKLITLIKENGFHQDTGILGNKYMHNVLGEAGMLDISLKMIQNPTYPSFRNWIDRGATTLWECWNGEGSRNHHMFSDFIAVFFKYLGGIKPDESEPGFKKIIMEPQINCGLEYVDVSHESLYGRIVCTWRNKDTGTEFSIHIPKGCSARFRIPGAKGTERFLGQGHHEFWI